MQNKIKSISFLVDGTRVFLHANNFGKFKVPYVQVSGGSMKTVEKMVYPWDVVTNKYIKDRDPTLTLSTGEKLRVYQGGDSSYMITRSASILDLHEEEKERAKNENLKRHRERQEKKNSVDIFSDIGDWC